jgi:putative redox protein
MMGEIMVQINLTYDGGLRTSAIHGPSGAQLLTDAPVDNHGRGESFSPTDLVATALGSCMATVMGIVAQRKGVILEGMKISVGKTMSATPPRRIAQLDVLIQMPLPADHPDRALLEATAHACPVHQSLHPEMVQAITFEYQ